MSLKEVSSRMSSAATVWNWTLHSFSIKCLWMRVEKEIKNQVQKKKKKK